MARLGDLCRFINGDRGKNYPSQAEISSDGDVPFINAGHLVDGKLDFSDMNYISEEKYNQLNSGKIQENDVLYCLRGSLGKKAIIKGISKGAIASSLVIIRPEARLINSDYLFYALESPTVQEQMMQANNGSSQPNLSAKSVSDYTFNLPTINKQCEIVLKLAKVNDLISLRKEQLAKLDQLVKSRFVELFGDIREVVPVSYYIKALTAGKSLAGEEECANKVLKTGAATYDEFDATQVKNLPMDYTPVPEHLLKDGDIIISRMNTAELVGATAYVWKAPLNTYLPDRLWRAELQPNANAIFVWQMLIQPSTKEQIRREASGTSGSMKNISKPGLLGLHVKKVPSELQDQFAAFVEQTDKSKLAIQQSLDKLELLKKSLMQEYFG